MKVSELTGPELDARVAKAEGFVHRGAIGEPYDPARKDDRYRYCRSDQNDWWDDPQGNWLCAGCYGIPYRYSSEWERGGPIVEREHITTATTETGWIAMKEVLWGAFDRPCGAYEQMAPTLLIAAMRCYVCSVLGPEVEDASVRQDGRNATYHESTFDPQTNTVTRKPIDFSGCSDNRPGTTAGLPSGTIEIDLKSPDPQWRKTED